MRRSVAMKLTGHKTESIYRRYAIVAEQDLKDGAPKLAALHQKKPLRSFTTPEQPQVTIAPSEFRSSCYVTLVVVKRSTPRGCPSLARLMARSSFSAPSSISARSMIRAGNILRTFPDPAMSRRSSRAFHRIRCIIALSRSRPIESFTISTPMYKPLPRTSPISS